MALKFKCKKCGNDIIVKFLKVGEPAKCPHCGFENIVPEDAITTDEVRDYSDPPTIHADSEIQVYSPESKLGPHTLGSVISGMFSVYGNSFGPMIVIALIVAVMTAIPIIMLVVVLVATTPSGPPEHFPWMLFLLVIPIWVLLILAQTLQQAVISYLAFDQYLEKPTLNRAWARVKGKYWRIVGATLLAGLAIIGLTLTIFGIPFALYYGGCWRFIAHVIIVEDCRVKESLMRSKELVTGHWWRLFGITLVIIICFFLVSFILNFIPFINVIASVVLAPLPIIVNTLLYLDVRVRKEGYVEETLKSDLRLAPAEVG